MHLSIMQSRRVKSVIERFGRHPRRSPIYGRVSSPEEEAYIEAGDFRHQNRIATVPVEGGSPPG